MNGEPNPWSPLGLPKTWAPSPLAWNLAKLRATTETGAEDMHVLILHGVNGTQGYNFSTDELKALANKMLEQCTGLVMAPSLPFDPRNRDERRHPPSN